MILKKLLLIRNIITIFTVILSMFIFYLGFKLINDKYLIIISIDKIINYTKEINDFTWQDFEKMLERLKRYNYLPLEPQNLNLFLKNEISSKRLYLITIDDNLIKNFNIIEELYTKYKLKVIWFFDYENMITRISKNDKVLINKLAIMIKKFDCEIGIKISDMFFKNNVFSTNFLSNFVRNVKHISDLLGKEVNYVDLPAEIVLNNSFIEKILFTEPQKIIFSKINDVYNLQKSRKYIPRIDISIKKDSYIEYLIPLEVRRGSLLLTISFFIFLLVIKDLSKLYLQ